MIDDVIGGVMAQETAALRAEVTHLEVRRGALLDEIDRLRSDHALTLHAIAEWLLPGAVPADLSADAVVAAASELRSAHDRALRVGYDRGRSDAVDAFLAATSPGGEILRAVATVARAVMAAPVADGTPAEVTT
jgi:hypothetical protein